MATKKELEDILTKLVMKSEDVDVCDEGHTLLDKAAVMVGLERFTEVSEDMEVELMIDAGYEIPRGADPTDLSLYEITIKSRFNGRKLKLKEIEIV